MMERILPGDTVEFTLGLHQVNEKRLQSKVVACNPQNVVVTLPDGNVIKRHRVKHDVKLIKGPLKVAQTPEAPKPEKEKGGKKPSLDEMFKDLSSGSRPTGS